MTAFTLPASSRGTGDGHGNAWNSNYIAGSSIVEDSARALRAKRGYHGDFETENFVVAGTLGANGKAAGSATSQDAEAGMLVASTFNGGQVDDVAPLLVSGDGPHGRSVGHNGMDASWSLAPVGASDGGTTGWSGESR